MAKGQTFTGTYARARPKVPGATNAKTLGTPAVTTATSNWKQLTKKAGNSMWTVYCAMSGNYFAIVTVLFVILLTFLLPDISQKIHTSKELKSMKQVLDRMSDDVKRAEVACLTVADEICSLHCNMHDDTTESSTGKLRNLSKFVDQCMRMTQSEPVPVEKKVSFLRRIFFPNRNASPNKEVTLMSYVYTNSFDARKPIEEEPETY